jgi:type IV pilus assembly protein PilV
VLIPAMKNASRPRKAQAGMMLLEGLIAILIFSTGILSLVGLQAASLRNVSDAKYRAEASFLADKAIGRMWVDNWTTLSVDYATGGPKFLLWKAEIQAPNTGLPGGDGTIVVGANNRITVTVQWQAPQDKQSHRHIATAQLQ